MVPKSAVLLTNVQLVIVGLAESQEMAPPARALFPLNVHSRMVGLLDQQ
jgi:hypothetical protein